MSLLKRSLSRREFKPDSNGVMSVKYGRYKLEICKNEEESSHTRRANAPKNLSEAVGSKADDAGPNTSQWWSTINLPYASKDDCESAVFGSPNKRNPAPIKPVSQFIDKISQGLNTDDGSAPPLYLQPKSTAFIGHFSAAIRLFYIQTGIVDTVYETLSLLGMGDRKDVAKGLLSHVMAFVVQDNGSPERSYKRGY